MASLTAVEAIFQAALEKGSAEERAGYLDQACQGDSDLRRQVERLLHAQQQLGSFLEQPAAAENATGDVPPGPWLDPADPPRLTEGPGTRIGPYKLLQQVGEGGMGVVYMAEQEQPVRRKVALKIIKPGMDSAHVIARFEAERQALALMDHPHIARVLDAGTTDTGRPYFVMELIKGVPITVYCDAHRLTPRERLELFVSVCQAVQHAHQKGVIHRDLKPSNVLVALHDARAVPTVIDFGVAKAAGAALTERTLFTGFGAVVGTLEYMAPEQAELSQLDIDTRSDIYSLGVLLYELLTGTTPLGRKRLKGTSLLEALRLIREEEPPRPSTRLATMEELPAISANRGLEPRRLSGLVRDELDWIVMKCLEKDRTRRYQSASALATDLHCYLRDEPVQACPPSTRYRFGKFARRHKAVLATTALVGVALLAAVAVLAVSAVRIAQGEQARSEALENEKRALAQKSDALERERQANLGLTKVLYRHRVALAHREWLAGNFAQAERLLEECPGELRRWEWHYLKRLCRNEEFTLPAQAHPLTGAALSPDGNCLAAAFSDRSIRVLDTTTGRERLSLRGHTRQHGTVAYSPDGRHLASGSYDGAVRVWDLQTGQAVFTLLGHQGQVYCVTYDPSGQRLASAAEDGTVRVWDVVTGREVLTLRPHPLAAASVAYSPDGRRLGSASRLHGGIKVWDAQTGRQVLALRGGQAVAFGKAVSGEGPLVVVPGEDGSTVNVWHGNTGKKVWALRGHRGPVWGVAVSADGRFLASASSDRTVKVWELTTGQEFRTFRGHDGVVRHVAFSPDGQKLTSTDENGTIKIWNLSADQQARTYRWPPNREVFGPAFNQDGRCLALVSGSKTVQVWDVAAERALLTCGPALWSNARISGDGSRLAWVAQDRTAVVCDLPSGQEVRRLAGLPAAGLPPLLSPDGRCLALEGMDRVMRIWDVRTGQELLAQPHAGLALATAFGPGGRRCALWLSGKGIRILDLVTGQEIRAFQEAAREVGRLQFSPDGERLAWISQRNTVKVAELKTGRELVVLRGPPEAIQAIVFSPDGERLASSSTDLALRVWELETGQEVLTLRGHTHDMGDLAFSPDGCLLVSTSRDRTLRIWDGTP